MSIAVTISGKTSELESYFQPPLTLLGKYECGLLYASIINSITKVNYNKNTNVPPIIKIECDLINGSYCDGLQTHIIHEFVCDTADHQYIETPQSVIYFPVNKNIISSISVKIVDQFGYCINPIEHIQLRLHLRKSI